LQYPHEINTFSAHDASAGPSLTLNPKSAKVKDLLCGNPINLNIRYVENPGISKEAAQELLTQYSGELDVLSRVYDTNPGNLCAMAISAIPNALKAMVTGTKFTYDGMPIRSAAIVGMEAQQFLMTVMGNRDILEEMQRLQKSTTMPNGLAFYQSITEKTAKLIPDPSQERPIPQRPPIASRPAMAPSAAPTPYVPGSAQRGAQGRG